MNTQVILKTTKGDITLEFTPEQTPKTVENFLDYVKSGHYNNTIFHRVIDGFMIQGGGFAPGLEEKETKAPIENEADKSISNKAGVIAMARTNDPHSASAQFFINLKDNLFLDHQAKNMQGWGYCTFGKVVDGMDVVEKIGKVKTGSMYGHDDVPAEEVIISEAYIVEV